MNCEKWLNPGFFTVHFCTSIVNEAPVEANLKNVVIKKHIFIDTDRVSAHTGLKGNTLLSHPSC
jgi:hypothetical protein